MQTLLVYPNPWSAFDKNGVPCGVCPRDPEADAGGPGQFVGARVDRKNTKVLQDFAAIHGGGGRGAKMAAHELRSPMQTTHYEYMGVASLDPELAVSLAAKDPIEIPATKYYKERLREGSLIAATQATAAAARAPFTPPKDFFAHRAPKLEAASEAPEGAETPLVQPAPEGAESPADSNPKKPRKPSQESSQ